MKTNELKDFKKRVINRFIQLKSNELKGLKAAQKSKLATANDDDIDNTNLAESPVEQIVGDIEMRAGALDLLASEIESLKSIDLSEIHSNVSFGSLVHSNVGFFLVGASMSQTVIEDKEVTGISTKAPLFLKMEGLKERTEFHLGNIEYVLLDIV